MSTLADHAAGAPITLLPVTGLPEFRPGDDLASAIAEAAPWLADGDVVVVTSKVLSKVEGRLVAVPADPEARDAVRREWVEAESVEPTARRIADRYVLGLLVEGEGDDQRLHGTSLRQPRMSRPRAAREDGGDTYPCLHREDHPCPT